MVTDHFPNEKRVLQELKGKGFHPAVIYDIGASTGLWSETMARVLPDANYHLFEPLKAHYHAEHSVLLRRQPNLTLHRIALGDTNGSAVMNVSLDRYSSSLHDPGMAEDFQEKVTVPVHRLDDYVARHNLPGPEVIKIDCQGFEDAILRGGARTVETAEVLFIETWLTRGYGPKTPLLHEIIEMLKPWGFTLVEFGETYYDARHRLHSIDGFFFSESLLERVWLAQVSGGADKNQELIRRLTALTSGSTAKTAGWAVRGADTIITHVEINDKHGTGVLLRRLFGSEPNLLTVRSANRYGGHQDVGGVALRISHESSSRDAVFARVLRAYGENTPKRILCAPYFADDVRTAIATREIFGAPMCTFLMDDQNVCADEIPDELMRELLEKSSLRLAISPQLRMIYEQKYGLPVWYMPPVVPVQQIPSELQIPRTAPDARHGVIIGNIWGQSWMERLRRTVAKSGVTLSWYSNGGFRDLSCDRESLSASSIFPHDPPSDDELVKVLRASWFAVLPSGSLDEPDDRSHIAQLSLPSRLVYLMATSHIPILVLGHRHTAAARFVEQFGIGLTVDYSQKSFIEAVTRITSRDENLAMRRRALAIAGRFTDAGAAEWIWQSLERGEPLDRRYEDLMPAEEQDFSRLLSVARAR